MRGKGAARPDRRTCVLNLWSRTHMNRSLRRPRTYETCSSRVYAHENNHEPTQKELYRRQRLYTPTLSVVSTSGHRRATRPPAAEGTYSCSPWRVRISGQSHRPMRPNHQPPYKPNSSQHTRKAPQGSSFLPPGPGSHRIRFRGP